MLTWIALGFLLGLQHALEADHIAAVATIASDKQGLSRIVRQGALWGLGHALTLGAFGGAVYGLKITLDTRLAHGLEFAVGVMLVLLGLRALYILNRERIHFHVHRHGGDAHFHAHSHRGESADHRTSLHAHEHREGGVARSLSVGMIHGLAGTAALVALTASTAPSASLGLIFIALFGLGSVIGMALFSAVIALPLSYTAKTLTWANRALQAVASVIAIGLGLTLMIETGSALAAGVPI